MVGKISFHRICSTISVALLAITTLFAFQVADGNFESWIQAKSEPQDKIEPQIIPEVIPEVPPQFQGPLPQSPILPITSELPKQDMVFSDVRFGIKSIREVLVYPGVAETIEANGKTYLLSDEPLAPVKAVILEIEGNGATYIEISKVGSVEFPTVLDEYAKGKYLFEHSGAGTYHVRSVNDKGRPVYTKFTIESPTPPPVDPPPVDPPPVDPPPVDPPPVDPPPVSDHSKLLETINKFMPNDAPVAQALIAAYERVLPNTKNPLVDLPTAKSMISDARRAALLELPPVTNNWNVFLVEVTKYMETLPDKAKYLEAISVMLEEMKRLLKPDSVRKVAKAYERMHKSAYLFFASSTDTRSPIYCESS